MSGRLLGKFSFSRKGQKRSPSSKSSPPSFAAPPTPPAPPKEYLCPISGQLMSDPVILSTGQTFDRTCIQACVDLGVEPPLPTFSDSSSSSNSQTPLPPSSSLVPNLAIRSSIHTWCYSTSSPFPVPLDLSHARQLVSSFPPSKPTSVASVEPLSGGTRSNTTISFNSSSTTTDWEVSTTTDCEDNSPADSPLEARILAKLRSPDLPQQTEGLGLLRRETRENPHQRKVLCTSNLLAALRPFLHSRDPSFQSNAAACLNNLSLEPANRTPVVHSGAVPSLVSALKETHKETRSNAAAALCALSADDENRPAIGALGALPPLLALLSGDNDECTCREALLALYHLSNCRTNRTKLAKLDSAGVLVRIVKDGGGVEALMVMKNLARCNEGRAVLMDAGAVEAVVVVLRGLVLEGGQEEGRWNLEVGYCVATIYELSKGSLRFRGLATAMGAEEALKKVAGEEEGGGGGGGERVKEMASRALRAVKGEDYVGGLGGGAVIYSSDESSGNFSSANGVASLPIRSAGGAASAGGLRRGGVKSMEF